MSRSLERGSWRRRGAVAVEYAFLLVGVGIPTIIGCFAGGRELIVYYQLLRDLILSPYP